MIGGGGGEPVSGFVVYIFIKSSGGGAVPGAMVYVFIRSRGLSLLLWSTFSRRVGGGGVCP